MALGWVPGRGAAARPPDFPQERARDAKSPVLALAIMLVIVLVLEKITTKTRRPQGRQRKNEE